jgi:hypothetical protein
MFGEEARSSGVVEGKKGLGEREKKRKKQREKQQQRTPHTVFV